MALIQTSLIWVAYAVALMILLIIASIFVFTYQKPGQRSVGVTVVCIFTLSVLLATVLLLPVDVALVSSTVKSSLGARKDWATQNNVDQIVLQLKIVYYTLYSLDAILCLLVVPFTYFLYEEYDENEAEDGSQTFATRLWGAFKYTLVFIAIVVILFLVGFFLPVSKPRKGETPNFDYFKHLLWQNHGERALTFGLGLLITIGTLVYILYTGPGLALLPVTFIKSAPSISAPTLAANTSAQLEENRERQQQLEARNQGRETMDSADRRELDRLLQEERILTRRERLAAESRGENKNILIRGWHKTEAVFRPLKLIGGFLLLIISLIIFTSMLITGIDKAKNSICKAHCGYILGHIHIFQPINALFVVTSKVFPIDYIIFLLLVIYLYSSSVVGIAIIGIRFLWLSIFRIRKGKTSPQAMLMATVILTLLVLAVNYSIAMMIAPQYATFGPQTYCDRPTLPGEQPDCTSAHRMVRPCSESADNPAAKDVCTPSVVSTFLNRIMINFPFFGLITFWAQFAFLAALIITFLTSLVRTPKLATDELDADLEEEAEEGLLSTTGRRFNASWQDITGRARAKNPAPLNRQDYGTASHE